MIANPKQPTRRLKKKWTKNEHLGQRVTEGKAGFRQVAQCSSPLLLAHWECHNSTENQPNHLRNFRKEGGKAFLKPSFLVAGTSWQETLDLRSSNERGASRPQKATP